MKTIVKTLIFLLLALQVKGQQPNGQFLPVKIIATKLTDSSKGTGFIVRKGTAYYLVTAKHVFYTTSLLKDYTMPEYKNSLQQCALLDYPKGNIIQQLILTDYQQKKILYNTFNIDEQHALDIAVLRIKKPVAYLKARAVSWHSLSKSVIPHYDDQVNVQGFPSRTKTYSDFQSIVETKKTQEMLDKDGKYFFIIKTESDLKGISGAPVFLHSNKNGRILIGIFVGQHHVIGELGYAIFAFYVAEIIRNYN